MAVKLRAAGYARVSVDREDSTSIAQQIDAIAAKCKQEGWLFDPEKDLFVDEGKSGSKRDVRRPAFEKMIEKASKYDRIVVYRFDRLSRRVAQLHNVIEDMDDLGVVVASATEGIDTGNPYGRMAITFASGMAAGEASAIRTRVQNTQAKMFVDGKWKGGARPYGWHQEKLEGGGVRLVLKNDEAAVLRKAVKMILDGKTIGGTARALNAAGHRTYNKTPFSPQMLSSVLRSELLLGRHVVNNKLSYGLDGKPITPHEALITLDEWNELQNALARLRIVRPKKGGAILAGVVYCGLCGGKLQGSSTESNNFANYRCRNKYSILNGKCKTGVSIKALAIDELVSLAVLEVLKKKKSVQTAGKRMRQTHSDAIRLRKKLEAEVEDARRIHTGIRDFFLRAGYKDPDKVPEYQADFATATDNLTKAIEALNELDEVIEEPADLFPWTTVKAIDVKWNKATNEEKNKVIRALIDRIDVTPKSPNWKRRSLDPGRVRITWKIPQ